MKPISQILIAPVITEMTSGFMLDEKSGAHKYAFKVNPSANKQEIRQAVESRFGVKVADVNTMIVRGKERRMRMQLGRRPNWKKAIVKLQPGMKISEFEGA